MVVRSKRVEIKKGLIGVISDTHGLVRPEAVAALQGVELIIHGGDIGKMEVLQSLTLIAPVYAIRGNNDRSIWAKNLPDILDLQINGRKFRVIHDLNELGSASMPRRSAVIVSGHSHKPSVATRACVLFVNPGSAGPRRFKLPVTVARLEAKGDCVTSDIVELLQ